MARNYMQGFFTPKHPEKYKGDPSKIKYRSSYELRFFEWADSRESVLEWNSEGVVIPYFDSGQNKKRRYIMDIYMKIRRRDGTIKAYLCEIKPSSQTIRPVMTKGKSKKTFLTEVETYTTNQCKWKAAEKFATQRGMEFKIINETMLFL